MNEKLIYMGNPKCGSTLIRTTFYEDFLSGKMNLNKRNNKSHSFVTKPLEALKNEYTLFSVIRNPFDLLVSYYTSNHQQNPSRGYIPNFKGLGKGNYKGRVSFFSNVKHIDIKGDSFEQFLLNFFNNNDRNSFQFYQKSNPFFNLFDKHDELICDYVIKLENIELELPKLIKNFKLNPSIKSNYKNLRSDGKYSEDHLSINDSRINPSRPSEIHYRDFYTPYTRELVEKNMHFPLDFFKYKY